MLTISFLFLILAILSLSYLLAIISYSGITTAFLWFWFVLGLFSFLSCIICFRFYTDHITLTQILNKPLKFTLLTLILLGITTFLTLEVTLITNAYSKPDKGADYVIVLGAQVRGSRVSRTLKARLDTAYTYIKDNPDSKVIVSGGQGPGEDVSEALAMKNYLLACGVSETQIVMEDRSTNTNENIKYSKAMIRDKDAKVVIVTSGFHVYRATRIAMRQGLTRVAGLGAPNDNILTLHYYVREFFAVVKDKVVGNI